MLGNTELSCQNRPVALSLREQNHKIGVIQNVLNLPAGQKVFYILREGAGNAAFLSQHFPHRHKIAGGQRITEQDGVQVSYGGTYTTDHVTKMATIPVGYADGYPRMLSNKGWVLIHGKKAPICGRVCMDQFMVDVTEIPDVKTGDEVTLLGKDGNEVISADTLGDLSGRFSYEFVCNISKRVPRIYIRDGKECGELTYFD